uniref:GDSL-type esterase/lipase family protein n=1 Tax=Prosthecobacter sp. TaxID=1965333 RepID=UPI0037CB887A
MKLRTLLLASLCVAATSFAETAKNLAIDPKPRDAGWMKRHESFNAISKKGEAQLVFLGDSITQGWEKNGKDVWAKTWEPLKAANFGIGGDRTEHVIWRLQNGNFDGIKPKLVVLMIGTNNTGHQGRPAAEHGGVVYASSPEQTAEGVKMILDILGKKLPEAKVLLLGIFPRGATKEDAMRKQNVATNNLISGLADNKRVYY